MTYLAVDEDGSEWVYNSKPIRGKDCNGMCWINKDENDDSLVELPDGSIKKLLGYKLTWEDEAVEIGD